MQRTAGPLDPPFFVVPWCAVHHVLQIQISACYLPPSLELSSDLPLLWRRFTEERHCDSCWFFIRERIVVENRTHLRGCTHHYVNVLSHPPGYCFLQRGSDVLLREAAFKDHIAALDVSADR